MGESRQSWRREPFLRLGRPLIPLVPLLPCSLSLMEQQAHMWSHVLCCSCQMNSYLNVLSLLLPLPSCAPLPLFPSCAPLPLFPSCAGLSLMAQQVQARLESSGSLREPVVTSSGVFNQLALTGEELAGGS